MTTVSIVCVRLCVCIRSTTFVFVMQYSFRPIIVLFIEINSIGLPGVWETREREKKWSTIYWDVVTIQFSDMS